MSEKELKITAPEGFLKIDPIKGLSKVPPKINWGKEYLDWPLEKKLDFAERLAGTMNQAADLLQKERNSLLEICKDQENKLAKAAISQQQQQHLIHKQIITLNAEKEELHKIVVEMSQEIKKLKKELKHLKGI